MSNNPTILHPRTKDLTGQRFGRWQILIFAGYFSKKPSAYWLCICRCGNKKFVSASSLLRGNTESCGCLQREILSTPHKKATNSLTLERRTQNLTGQRFGRLVVLEFAGYPPGHGWAQWRCICDCGETFIAYATRLMRGHARSCGCMKRTQRPDLRRIPEYYIWCGMKQRCNNPKADNYTYYGGRGIKVCQRWQKSFEAFLGDMGRRLSPKHTIDRIDNNGPYSPENCRWATHSEQMQNIRMIGTMLTFEGKTQNITMWAREKGMGPETLRRRIKSGWDIARALIPPEYKSQEISS